MLDAVVAELRDARTELTEFARGIHPRALTEGGLGTALPALVRRSGSQVELNVQPGRLAPPIEAAVYYVCSEALTNVAKHARARRVAIEIRWPRDQVKVIIEDDGVGGADAKMGSGLRGLVDRVEALGGRVEVDSQPGLGTRVEATLPIDTVASSEERG